jgi:hypothetical protein
VTFCILPHNCTIAGNNALSNSSLTSTPENVSIEPFSVSKTFAFNQIPRNFTLGNFTIHLVNNQTGYEVPPMHGVSRVILGFVFAFNISLPDGVIINTYFGWWPPCSSTLGVPCQTNNQWVLPSLDNATIGYLTNNLYISWNVNSTGLYVAFSQGGPVIPTRTTSQSQNSNATTTMISRETTAVNQSSS